MHGIVCHHWCFLTRAARGQRAGCAFPPLGLYRLTAVPTPLERGTLVLLPVPPALQAWQSRWVPLLKPVAAIAGETVCVLNLSLWVEEQWYGPVLEQAHGKPLLRMEGCVTLAEGEVFVASPAPNSLDGRYFGPIAATALTAQAVPLFTWGDMHGR